MEAVRGVFNSDADRLVMQDKITVATSSGVTGELTHASLDTKTQTLRAHQRVHFELTNGTVKANALTFNSAEHVLTFRGKVMVHITKPQKTAEATSGDAKPKQAKHKFRRRPHNRRLTRRGPRPRQTGPLPTRWRSHPCRQRPNDRVPLASLMPRRHGRSGSSRRGLLLATPLEAQTLTNSFGGLSQSSNEPIDIEF